jgi:adenosylhomocysteine nucleosidase
MSKIAIVAALRREVKGLLANCRRVHRDYQGRGFVFFEGDNIVVVCGGIGAEAARRAAEAVINLYNPDCIYSVGFAGSLDDNLRVGNVVEPATVIDARDGSRIETEGKEGILVTFMNVAGAAQKASLAKAYGAQLVDMEAASVARAAAAHGVKFGQVQFGAIKAVSDESSFEIPGFEIPKMERFVDSHGRFKTGNFALFVAVRPWLWRRVAVLARNSRKAGRALGERLNRLCTEQPVQQVRASGAVPSTKQFSGEIQK